MNWLCDTNWFAVKTKRFRESVAASSLLALGLEVFLPMIKVDCLLPTVIRVNSKPLFPAYLFTRFDTAASLDAVESARGVLHVIKSGGCPVPVEDLVISELRDRVESDGLIRLARRELRAGDRVSIQAGPFAGLIGKVQAELDDGNRVAILLEALWCARVLISARWVEVESV